MGIDEGERRVLGQGDPLAGRRQRVGEIRALRRQRRGQRKDRVEVERALGHVGQAVEMRHQVGMLAGLHQAEVALRQRQRRVALDRADHRQADRLDGVAGQFSVPFAAQPVQHHAGDFHGRIVGGKAFGDGGGGLRLAGNVEHQQHREAVEPCEVGGRAGTAGRRPECRRTGPWRFRRRRFRRPTPLPRPAPRARPAASPSCPG